jgi:hypothetical protein
MTQPNSKSNLALTQEVRLSFLEKLELLTDNPEILAQANLLKDNPETLAEEYTKVFKNPIVLTLLAAMEGAGVSQAQHALLALLGFHDFVDVHLETKGTLQ